MISKKCLNFQKNVCNQKSLKILVKLKILRTGKIDGSAQNQETFQTKKNGKNKILRTGKIDGTVQNQETYFYPFLDLKQTTNKKPSKRKMFKIPEECVHKLRTPLMQILMFQKLSFFQNVNDYVFSALWVCFASIAAVDDINEGRPVLLRFHSFYLILFIYIFCFVYCFYY